MESIQTALLTNIDANLVQFTSPWEAYDSSNR